MDTVGKNTVLLQKYIAEQHERDKETDQLNDFYQRDLFMNIK